MSDFVVITEPVVKAGALAEEIEEKGLPVPEHDCMDWAVPYESDGVLGHGWECGVCGGFLQAG